MRKKISSAMPFMVIIAVVLLQRYCYSSYWWLLLIPLTPMVLGLIKIKLSFDTI